MTFPPMTPAEFFAAVAVATVLLGFGFAHVGGLRFNDNDHGQRPQD